MQTVTGAPRTKTIDFSGKSKLRTGPKILTGPGSTSGIYTKEKEANRAKLRDNHLKDFPSEQAFNDWADYLYDYKTYTGKDLTFPAAIQSEGVGGAVVKGGSRAVSRALPRIFRSFPNMEGPVLITAPVLRDSFRNRAYPEVFQDLTPLQIQQYAFGPAHNNTSYPEGAGTLADYIQEGGNPNDPEIRPFMDLFAAEASRTENQSLQDMMNQRAHEAAKIPLPEDASDEQKLPPANVVRDSPARSRLWTDIWKGSKNKPVGGQSKNGKWRKEMEAILDGESIPPRDSAEYPAFLEKLKQKFYNTGRGSAYNPGSASSSSAEAPVVSGDAAAPASSSSSGAPVVNNLPVEAIDATGANLPPVRLQPGRPSRTRGGGGGPPEPSRGPGGTVMRGPNAPGNRVTTRKIPIPLPLPPSEEPKDPRVPREKPRDPKDPEDPQGVPDTTVDVDPHKLVGTEGYGYIRPEFSTDTGAENLILSDKEQLHELNQWDKFDEVTDAIYTLDNPLYLRQLKKDKERFSGIAKDPFFYLGEEYAKHIAPDDIKIYATQGSMFNANNQMTALGQVRRVAFDNVGPRERGLAYRNDPDYEMSLLEAMYENPDLEAQIQHSLMADDNIDDIDTLITAMNKANKVTLANRWTTDTSILTFNDAKLNLQTLQMELK